MPPISKGLVAKSELELDFSGGLDLYWEVRLTGLGLHIGCKGVSSFY